MPVARTRFGGRIGSGEATATKWIIGVCVAVYLVELAFPAFMYTWLAFTPGPADLPSSFAGGAWWQPLTAAFLHSTPLPLHLMFNMYALYIVGPYLEQRLGRSRFLATYLLSALGGSVLVLLLHAAGGVGASGAVFGLFGSWFVVNRRLGVSAGPVLALIAINLVLSFTIARISWQAHVGGLITGVALTALLVYAPARNRVLVQWSGIGAAAVVLLALLVVGAVAMQA
jgi:membrane associated rhomboid family serine protease